MKKIIILLLLTMLPFGYLYAHGDEKHKNKKTSPDTVVVVGGDTVAINGKPYQSGIQKNVSAEENEAETEEAHEEDAVSIWAAFEHLHNKIIHFPIALGVLLFLFMTIGYKQEVCNRASKIIVLLGTIASVAAVITGYSQIAPFEGTPAYQLVEIHRIIGFIVLGIYLIMSWAVFTKQSNKTLLLLSILLTIAISAAGFYGGVIAH